MKKREIMLIVVFLGLFYKIIDTGSRLVTEPFKARSGLWQNWTTENAGESLVVPQETTEIRSLLVENNFEDFFLSPELINNPLIYQRTIESLFPRRFTNKSANHFFLNNEDIPLKCKKMTERLLVTLARCD